MSDSRAFLVSLALAVSSAGLLAAAPSAEAGCFVNLASVCHPEAGCLVNAVLSSCTGSGTCRVNVLGACSGSCDVNLHGACRDACNFRAAGSCVLP